MHARFDLCLESIMSLPNLTLLARICSFACYWSRIQVNMDEGEIECLRIYSHTAGEIFGLAACPGIFM
jgi:hypothetical protein